MGILFYGVFFCCHACDKNVRRTFLVVGDGCPDTAGKPGLPVAVCRQRTQKK
ncbi:hypothetical protein BRYFOR_06762 [Marvinbryantia formatexigens DSM 14469]|uniref:Uncharacterized protein n=1 Tax=Marvinbryantia formatexigens DSM 14469 TaxID=478749 RepID=C6LDR3_9FIRM|nr:hypothetical protein BRYFOR_06762 [Marvinbryantia formatexigens DSM 14469]